MEMDTRLILYCEQAMMGKFEFLNRVSVKLIIVEGAALGRSSDVLSQQITYVTTKEVPLDQDRNDFSKCGENHGAGTIES